MYGDSPIPIPAGVQRAYEAYATAYTAIAEFAQAHGLIAADIMHALSKGQSQIGDGWGNTPPPEVARKRTRKPRTDNPTE